MTTREKLLLAIGLMLLSAWWADAQTSGGGSTVIRAIEGFINSSTSAPTGTERGLITRNIPSGTQTISGSVTTSASQIATANNAGSCISGAGVFTVAASNASRTYLAVWANPANTDDLFVNLSSTANATNARLAPGQSVNWNAGRIYTGQISAFPNSGTQSACLIELN